jgi:hypothetical protein
MRLTLRTPTDTATPQPVIPIFFIHTIENPFCDQPVCWCQASKAGIAPLLTDIRNGDMLLHEADVFTDSQTEGGRR